MYKSDNDGMDRWDDEPEAGADEFRGVLEGWLIQSTAGPPSTAARQPRMSSDGSKLGAETDRPRYLQIGTGQWCGAEYATLFPLYSTAIVYAKEFGYVVGETVRIVKHRF